MTLVVHVYNSRRPGAVRTRARDEAAFKENEHPRDPAGKFATSGSSGGAGGLPSGAPSEEHKKLASAIDPTFSGASEMVKLHGASIKQILTKTLVGTSSERDNIRGVIKALEGPPSYGHGHYSLIKALRERVKQSKSISNVKKAANALKKHAAYSPPAPPSTTSAVVHEDPETKKKAEYWIRNQLTGGNWEKEQMNALIPNIKDLETKKAVESKLAQSYAKTTQAKEAAQQEQNKKVEEAAAKLKAEKEASAKVLEEHKAALGISDTEALGFDALLNMVSGGSAVEKQKFINKFKTYQKEAENLGYPISGFQYALIRNYIDGGYLSVNAALRGGSMTMGQHLYVKMVNDALDKVPKYSGTVVRGTHLPQDVVSKYKPGYVVEESGFTSTGVGFKFGGNVIYTIKATGKRGANLSTGANIHEKEVLFKAHTFFLVHSVKKAGSETHIEMEEVDGH